MHMNKIKCKCNPVSVIHIINNTMQWPIRNKLSLRCKLLIKGLHNLGVYSKQKNKGTKDQ